MRSCSGNESQVPGNKSRDLVGTAEVLVPTASISCLGSFASLLFRQIRRGRLLHSPGFAAVDVIIFVSPFSRLCFPTGAALGMRPAGTWTKGHAASPASTPIRGKHSGTQPAQIMSSRPNSMVGPSAPLQYAEPALVLRCRRFAGHPARRAPASQPSRPL